MRTFGLNKIKIGLYLSLVLLAFILGVMERCSDHQDKPKERRRVPVTGQLILLK
jgi:hypothetical protein